MSEQNPSVAIVVYGKSNSGRNALSEKKYKSLAEAFTEHDYVVRSVLYNDEQAEELSGTLTEFDAVLVWVNPIEQGHDRSELDKLLIQIASKGCFVSTHPDVILKMGTKDILYKTRNMDWGSNIKMYSSFEQFKTEFPISLNNDKIRVLKQYRGNGGNGVFKTELSNENVTITHAISGNELKNLTISEFFDEFQPFFSNGGLLIDQEWNDNIENGMVRCYVSGTKVAGFGYQEINALYKLPGEEKYIPPGKRYYFTENCGIFRDLKEIMENKWIAELQENLSIEDKMMPVIWDADFFINNKQSPGNGKYTLCEINVSCVSPFPPSAIKFIVAEVGERIKQLS